MPIQPSYVCPSCQSADIFIFYQVRNVPINSCAMLSDKEEALNYPCGDVVLGFCKNCGFIFNVAFEPLKIDYGKLAPEEQGFSATFNSYAQRLATHLIQSYDLKDKLILEIGCGRGDFLALLCELGYNNGVGIDPSSVSGDVKSDAKNRMTFIRDYYSERYASYNPNLICCRHTLEHIHKTAEFVKSLRHSIAKNLGTYVFFEVPDVTRILHEIAFWDIYYEHCSYFNLGSLARLFRSCGFELTNLVKDYFDQYLLIEGKPVEAKSERMFAGEETIEQTSQDVMNFSSQCKEKLERWRKQIWEIKAAHKKTVVWGSGSKCVAFMTTLHVKDEIEYIVDINPRRHGKFIPGAGKQIIAPEFLKEYRPDAVIIMNPAYCNEIKHTLEDMGLTPELLLCS